MFWYFLITAVVSFVAGYLFKRNNPYIKNLDELIDKVDEGGEEKLQELIKKLQEKVKK